MPDIADKEQMQPSGADNTETDSDSEILRYIMMLMYEMMMML